MPTVNSQTNTSVFLHLCTVCNSLESEFPNAQVNGDESNRYNCDCGVEVEEWGVLSSVPEENETEVADASSELRRSSKGTAERGKQSPNSEPRGDKIGDVTKQLENLSPATTVTPMQNDVSTYFPIFRFFFSLLYFYSTACILI